MQHAAAVVNPLRTTLSPCMSSHTTLPSKVAAWPSTWKPLFTVAPSPGSR